MVRSQQVQQIANSFALHAELSKLCLSVPLWAQKHAHVSKLQFVIIQLLRRLSCFANNK
jgi:hypothetical protein